MGKSNLGIQIAQHFNGEIINADSRQVYRYMDIGTAKLGLEEREKVPHYLIDIISPNESYSVAQYQEDANAMIQTIWSRGKIPVLVGGSGQYIWAVIDNWEIPHIKPDPGFRESLYSRAMSEGYNAVYTELSRIDPVAALKIQPTNIRRVIRALEIYHQTGTKPSELQKKGITNYPVLLIGLTAERDILYKMIDSRADEMIQKGLVDEVKQLLGNGYGSELPSMSGIGYSQIARYLDKRLKLEDAIQEIKYSTHRYARSQYNWFRLNNPRIKWYNVIDDIQDEIHYTIKTFLKVIEPG